MSVPDPSEMQKAYKLASRFACRDIALNSRRGYVSAEDEEDVVSEAVLSAFTAENSGEGHLNRMHLLSTAVNTELKRCERNFKRFKGLDAVEDLMARSTTPPENDENLEFYQHLAIRAEHHISGTLRKMRPRDREALERYYRFGLPVPDRSLVRAREAFTRLLLRHLRIQRRTLRKTIWNEEEHEVVRLLLDLLQPRSIDSFFERLKNLEKLED